MHLLTPFLLPPLALFILIGLAILAGIYFVARVTPKRFYIVRHGQTVLNEQHIKQGADGKLTTKGESQAHRLGLYLKQFPVTTILTSPYQRAVQTAEIIRAYSRGRLVVAPLLAERRNPTEVLGKSTQDPLVQDIVGKIERGYHDDDFRYSDEENFADLKRRAAACLDYLARSPGTTSVVVTHHALLQMLLSYMLYRDELHAADYVKLAFFNPAENGGVTICEYHPWKRFSKTHGWEVISYNENIG
ncbi:MAG: hypothetical protein JWO84_88 [Parcubacteria group bacterium]|nr:hypothetical protein [Parcubacteria group bacterium]